MHTASRAFRESCARRLKRCYSRFEYVVVGFFLAAGADAGFFSGTVSSMMIFFTPWSVMTTCGDEELTCRTGWVVCIVREGWLAGVVKLATGILPLVSQVEADCWMYVESERRMRVRAE